MKKQTATPKEITELVEKKLISNLVIDGEKKITVTVDTNQVRVTLLQKKQKMQFRVVGREIIETKTTQVKYPLMKVTEEELRKYRENGTPSFVLKTPNGLFYTEVPKDFSLVSAKANLNHKCATCHRLSAAKDENGGCPKVRERAKHIEKFARIMSGVETFNLDETNLLVNECWYYEKIDESARKKNK